MEYEDQEEMRNCILANASGFISDRFPERDVSRVVWMTQCG